MAGGPSAFQAERKHLAAELKRVREGAGLTTREMAAAMGVSQTKVVHMESGQRGAQPADVAAWARAAGLAPEEAGRLSTRARQLQTDVTNWRQAMKEAGRSGMADIQREWLVLEQLAPVQREYQAVLMPGLLQTAEYARQVFAAEEEGGQDLVSAVAVRMERQARLYNSSKRFEFVIHEAALRWRVGPVDGHLAQLDRIRQMGTLSNVYLGIIPLDVEAPIWRYHPFVILDGPADYEGPVEVFVELLGQNVVISDPVAVERYRRAFRQLQAVAVTGSEATAIIDAAGERG
jgi:transcriptional regulator with XRE-family HTH domain